MGGDHAARRPRPGRRRPADRPRRLEGENPNNVREDRVHQQAAAFQQFEYVATRNGRRQHQHRRRSPTAPREAYVRGSAAMARARYIAECVGRRRGLAADRRRRSTSSGIPNLKIGLKISDNADADSTARFDCSSAWTARTASRRTARRGDPAQADGELGWYTSRRRSRSRRRTRAGAVEKIEYRIDDGAVQTYDGAFQVTGAGDHTVRYWADGRRRGAQRRAGQRARRAGRRDGARDGHRPRPAGGRRRARRR